MEKFKCITCGKQLMDCCIMGCCSKECADKAYPPYTEEELDGFVECSQLDNS